MTFQRIRPAISSTILSLFVGLAAPAMADDAVAPASAAVEAPSATAFVQTRVEQIFAIVNAAAPDEASLEAKREEMRTAIRDFLSFELLAERTLGDTWDTRTPEQRTEFVALLRDLIETSYLRDLGTSSVDDGAYTATYTGERSRRDRTTVEGTVSVSGDEHLIEVKMQSTDAGWLVYDLVTDDVSLEESYAESFESIIADDGWDGLLTRMRERLDEMRAD